MPDPTTLDWGQFGTIIAAVGAFGTAAFGLVESLGKMFTISWTTDHGHTSHNFGLPFAGFGIVKNAIKPLGPALQCAYGNGYLEIIAQQYRVDRVDGAAPDTIRQGVRLGLPFMPVTNAAKLIGGLWDLNPSLSLALAQGLQSPLNSPPAAQGAAPAASAAPALAGRFAAAMDARITAAFELADERYENRAKSLAGAVAVLLAWALNYAFPLDGNTQHHSLHSFVLATFVGLISVPLAPVAKDVASNLQNALTAFKSIAGKS